MLHLLSPTREGSLHGSGCDTAPLPQAAVADGGVPARTPDLESLAFAGTPPLPSGIPHRILPLLGQHKPGPF
eukprot:3838747-Amphidinium_carterae.1